MMKMLIVVAFGYAFRKQIGEVLSSAVNRHHDSLVDAALPVIGAVEGFKNGRDFARARKNDNEK